VTRPAWCLVAAAAGLLLGPAAAQAAPDNDESGAVEAAPAPALRSQVFQRSRATFELQAERDASSPMERARRATLGMPPDASPLHALARGTLWRTQLAEHANLSLRLRGGKVGLYLAVRLTSGD